MNKRTMLFFATAAALLVGSVPNEIISADTPNAEVIQEIKVGSVIQQGNIKYKVLSLEGDHGKVQVGNGITPIQFESNQDGKDFIIPSEIKVGNKIFTVSEIGEEALSYYPDETGRMVYYPSSITVPVGVKTIQKNAFRGSKAKTVQFAENSELEKIGDNAFSFSELEQLTLPASLEYIGTRAFDFSQNLKKLEFAAGSKLELISHEAFSNLSSLEKLTLPKYLKTLGSNPFRFSTSLKSVNVEDGNEAFASIDGVLFSKDKKQLIYYPSQKAEESYKTPSETQEILGYAFNKNNFLKNLELNEGLQKIGSFAFADAAKLEHIHLPASLKSIERLAFYGNLELQELVLPDNVEHLEKHVMNGLPKLRSLTIGKNIHSLPSAFLTGKLDSLKEVRINSENSAFSMQKDTFEVPAETKFIVKTDAIKEILKNNLSTKNEIVINKEVAPENESKPKDPNSKQSKPDESKPSESNKDKDLQKPLPESKLPQSSMSSPSTPESNEKVDKGKKVLPANYKDQYKHLLPSTGSINTIVTSLIGLFLFGGVIVTWKKFKK
ncbi:Cell surface protein [Streptococcus constellatus]|nr:Cell surface protein [Streptococcus constellatus]